jgi:hypothetical protein
MKERQGAIGIPRAIRRSGTTTQWFSLGLDPLAGLIVGLRQQGLPIRHPENMRLFGARNLQLQCVCRFSFCGGRPLS